VAVAINGARWWSMRKEKKNSCSNEGCLEKIIAAMKVA